MSCTESRMRDDARESALVAYFVNDVGLGPRAGEVAALLVSGTTSDKEIARSLRISRSRAHELVQCLLAKWGLDRRAALAVQLALLAAGAGAPVPQSRRSGERPGAPPKGPG